MENTKQSPEDAARVQKEIENQVWKGKVESFLKASQQAFQPTMWEWYINYLFYRGQHYTSINKEDGRIKHVKKGVTVNFVRPVVRAISNNVNKMKLKTTVLTTSFDDDTVNNATNLSIFWDKKSEELELGKMYRKIVKLGCITGTVPVRCIWDKNKKDAVGDLDIGIENPFLVFPDPQALHPDQMRYMIRIVKRSIDDCINDPDYDKFLAEKLNPEAKVTDSPVFDQVIAIAEKVVKNMPDFGKKHGSVWVRELYIKENVEIDAENVLGEPTKKSVTKIRKVVYAQGHILCNYITDLEEFPIVWYQIEEDEMAFYPDGWVRDLVPLVQSINKHETQIIEYVDRLNGGIVKMMGGTIKLSRLEDGTKVYEIDGALVDKIEQFQLPPLPSNIDNVIARFRRYIEDIGAFTEASRGVAPSGGQSGEYVKALMAGDSNNTVEIKDNIADFATRLAKMSLWNIAKYQNAERTITYEKGDEKKAMSYVGAETPLGQEFGLTTRDGAASNTDLLAITTDNNIRIEQDSDILYTMQGRQEEIIKLYALKDEQGRPIIPISKVMQMFGFGNVKELMKELKEERLQEKAEAMAQAAAENAMIEKEARAAADAELGIVSEEAEAPVEEEPTEEEALQQYANQALYRGKAAQRMLPQE